MDAFYKTESTPSDFWATIDNVENDLQFDTNFRFFAEPGFTMYMQPKEMYTNFSERLEVTTNTSWERLQYNNQEDLPYCNCKMSDFGSGYMRCQTVASLDDPHLYA